MSDADLMVMNSKARIAGHPVHPMLVSFPIALYTSTVAALLAYMGTHDAFWFRVALVANVAGVVMAVVAVIPGAIDLFALPRPSPARTTGLRHAGFNAVATGLFSVTAVLLYRSWNREVSLEGEVVLDAAIPLALSVVAWISMLIGGALGWTLVQTHHVGVKPAFTRPAQPLHEPELEGLEEASIPPAQPGEPAHRGETMLHH